MATSPWVVLAHDGADHLGALLVLRLVGEAVVVVHPEDDAALHGLQAVAHVRQRAAGDDRERVVQVAPARLLVQRRGHRVPAAPSSAFWRAPALSRRRLVPPGKVELLLSRLARRRSLHRSRFVAAGSARNKFSVPCASALGSPTSACRLGNSWPAGHLAGRAAAGTRRAEQAFRAEGRSSGGSPGPRRLSLSRSRQLADGEVAL